MQNIIALSGKKCSGKTSTLLWLIALLDNAENRIPVPVNIKNTKDKRITFNYNGKKISITTYGDGADIIKENCNFFVKENCDVAVSACWSRGATNDELNKFAKLYCLKVNYLSKVIDCNINNQEQINFKQAQQLFSML